MIGPGTGIAPMRALLQERAYLRAKMKQNVGPNILYFGCKNREQDFIYADELEQYQKDGTLTQLHLAFSRENKEKKVYVQHILSSNATETWSLINSSHAYVYVCGGVKMGQDVSDVFRRMISEVGGLDSVESKAYLDRMTADGRFVQELWA
jgi:NADPH-ferrihemoprotein reductase